MGRNLLPPGRGLCVPPAGVMIVSCVACLLVAVSCVGVTQGVWLMGPWAGGGGLIMT